MTRWTAGLAAWVVACAGHPHPAQPPAFDAKRLAAELDAVMSEMAGAAQRWEADCPHMVDAFGELEARARGPISQARQAQQDPERAKQLTTELRSYDTAASGRSKTIAVALAVCWKTHRELRDQVQRVVDSMPTL